ncbi:hypothetical protein BGZ61DRAFT_556772 [Ilyonectria robusta]|uniref:uncharacterized protein n=1 Tax=Ilyonectria robusta TaxID=1079257 RepID=UPI001E8D99EC|nr:uncharacterized protein BGZ61DRAFT_556772 [Ilyonectria robusta]KAH8670623.1 hypothetical protein BGZ61DRAFT_556772 [Ilyonectria robusta]
MDDRSWLRKQASMQANNPVQSTKHKEKGVSVGNTPEESWAQSAPVQWEWTQGYLQVSYALNALNILQPSPAAATRPLQPPEPARTNRAATSKDETNIQTPSSLPIQHANKLLIVSSERNRDKPSSSSNRHPSDHDLVCTPLVAGEGACRVVSTSHAGRPARQHPMLQSTSYDVPLF